MQCVSKTICVKNTTNLNELLKKVHPSHLLLLYEDRSGDTDNADETLIQLQHPPTTSIITSVFSLRIHCYVAGWEETIKKGKTTTII